MNPTESNTLVMQSNPEGITMVDPFLRSISTIAHLSFDRYHNLLVAVTEAVNNAIIHAHHFDSEKLITLEVITSENQISIRVSDCGAGFNVNDVPDPRLPENVLREGGRGVFLIRRLSDASEFQATEKGMAVTMNFIVKY